MISIIIPTFQQVEFLSECIDSILNQNWWETNYEVIIVVDGSTDASLEVAKKYQTEYPSIKIIFQVNKGLASARNTGIMNAMGEWVLPVDSDDILLNNCVEKLEEVIKQNSDADIIAPSFKTFGTTSQEVILMPNPTIEDFKTANRVGYCAAIKRSALLEVGGYSPRMTWGYEDLHLWFNLLSRGKKLITIPEVLWMYRTKEQSMITEAQKHHEELMAQIKKDFPQIWQTS